MGSDLNQPWVREQCLNEQVRKLEAENAELRESLDDARAGSSAAWQEVKRLRAGEERAKSVTQMAEALMAGASTAVETALERALAAEGRAEKAELAAAWTADKSELAGTIDAVETVINESGVDFQDEPSAPLAARVRLLVDHLKVKVALRQHARDVAVVEYFVRSLEDARAPNDEPQFSIEQARIDGARGSLAALTDEAP